MSRVNLERGEVGECGLGRAGLGAGWSVADALPGPDRGRTVTGKLEQRAAPALGRATRASHPADGDTNAGSLGPGMRGQDSLSSQDSDNIP